MRRPTPIPVSRTVRNLILLAILAMTVLIVWAVPAVLVISMGGFALALVLSFPVSLFETVVPRIWAILLSFLLLIIVLLVALLYLAPLLARQVAGLITALPGLLRNLERYVIAALETLDSHGLLSSPPQEIASRLSQELSTSVSAITGSVLGRTLGLVFGTFSLALTLLGIAFVAASLLANTRGYKAAFLATVPKRYRYDARELWASLSRALSRYLAGLALIVAVQGTVSAAALYLIGIPYPLALGAWVAITAVIPILGAWLGAIPAVIVAFSVSPTAVVLTAIAFVLIQQLEGNFLTPRIQSETIKVPSVAVFLAVIAGGALGGIMGVLFAVPTLAVIRVLFDFLRVRLRTT